MSHQFKTGDKVLVGPVKSDPCEEGETYVKAGAIGVIIGEAGHEGQMEVAFDDASKLVVQGADLCWFVDTDRLTLLADSQPAAPVSNESPFTQRQRAAIDLRVPDSGTPWLDEMIRQAVRKDVATEVLSGLLANCGGPVQANQMCGTNYCNGTKEMTVEWAVDLADALLARIGGAK